MARRYVVEFSSFGWNSCSNLMEMKFYLLGIGKRYGKFLLTLQFLNINFILITMNKLLFTSLSFLSACQVIGAPHLPLQAPKERVEACRNRYRVGYDWLRQQRFERQKAMGLVDFSADSFEVTDLAAQYPEKVEELERKWQDWAERQPVFPFEYCQWIERTDHYKLLNPDQKGE